MRIKAFLHERVKIFLETGAKLLRRKIKNLIVGSGFAGATIANLLATKLNQEVLIIDSKPHLAGNSFDYFDENGICIHKYGSHIFHTQSDEVWGFVTQFADFNSYEHKVYVHIDGQETTIPFNLNSINDSFEKGLAQRLEKKLSAKFEYGSKVTILDFLEEEDEDLKFLANYIYEKVFLNYTTKQWGKSPKNLDGKITARLPVFVSRDNRYFQDKHQGIPENGYTELVKNMLSHPNIELRLNCDFNLLKDDVECENIFYTGSIDEFFDYKFGVLPYRCVNFELSEVNQEFFQRNSVVNYPNDYDFTRIHEYKYYLQNKSPKTVIAKEYSEDFELGKNERFYPRPEGAELYEKYLKEAANLDNTYFLGRLGDYKYYDMDKTILRALELFENFAKKGYECQKSVL